jgi:Xaa-Pro aminopeptidase
VQRAVYEVVLDAQAAAIDKVRAGNHWNQPHEAAVRAITQGLVKLGLLKGPLTRLVKDQAYQPFFNHRTGHWLGIDVHDVGAYYQPDGSSRPLQPGMVLTVEPGLYIAADDERSPEALRGIGVRIEDDVLVSATGNENLTAAAPKTVADIEALMQH